MSKKLLVKDVMIPKSKFVECREDDSVQKISGQIVTGGVGSVLVYDIHRKDYIGLVTKTDIVEAMWTGKLHHKEGIATAKDIMNYGLIGCQENDEVEGVIDMIIKQQIHHVIVKDFEKNIVGLVTALDIAKELVKNNKDDSGFFGLFSIHKKTATK